LTIKYLKSPNDNLDRKVEYLNGLTNNLYRYGSKYKYDCHLSKFQVLEILNNVKDNELYKAYYHKEKEINNNNVEELGAYFIIGFVIIIAVLALFYGLGNK
jgi:hypothetical protein